MLINICDIQPNKINSNLKSKFFFFYGEQGTWKTTVASQFSKPLLAGFEIGYQFIEGIRAIPMTSWSDMKDLVRQLKTAPAKEMYDTIIFDTISNAYQMCYKYVCGQLGVNDPGEVGFGKGWRAIKEEFSIIKEISRLGYGLVFIAHAKETEITDAKTKETTIKIKSDLDSTPSAMIDDLCDFVFYVRKELEDDGVTENVYAYSDLNNASTKRRLRNFPRRFLFSYENICKGIQNAIGDNASSEENLRIVKEESWEAVRDDVIKLITELSETPASDEINRYIPELFGETRISQTTALHKDKLIAARDYLISLKDRLSGR